MEKSRKKKIWGEKLKFGGKMLNNPRIFRKRLIPLELVELKEDEVLAWNQEVLVTRWKVLKPRRDFAKGDSCYFLKRGFKISRFLDKNGKLVYYYCDIIKTSYNEEENAYTFLDLLADVIIYPGGFVRVVDVEEISDALDQGLISVEETKEALRQLSDLLKIIYSGKWKQLIKGYLK